MADELVQLVMVRGLRTLPVYLFGFIIAGTWLMPYLGHAECGPLAAHPTGVDDVYSRGWGIDARNTRFQPRSEIRADNVDRLQLKWAYALHSSSPRSYPLVTRDTIYIGDSGYGLVALDRDSGCERWVFSHSGEISSAILHGRVDGRDLLMFNDRTDGVYAIDANSGELAWHAAVDDEPVPWYSGTPLITANTVYVPVSSLEVVLAVNPFYGCCTTSGGMAAFDLATGAKRWYRPTIEGPAIKTGSHFGFVQKHGPSGAPVWATPSFHAKHQLLFFGTGQNYSHPTTTTSDAIFALDAQTGAVRWVEQFTADDAYTAACNNVELNHPNCPKPMGPDVDFGAPTVLTRSADGRDILLAGQKSADVHALDPVTGERIWSRSLGRGGIIGGVHWGLAVNEALGLAYVPISDKGIRGFPSPGTPAPGMYALDIATGALKWRHWREARCSDEECVYGLSAAPLATEDLIFVGSMDGYLEALHAESGEVLWSYDAWREFATQGGGTAVGGAFDAHGPAVADDLLIVTAGYGYVGRQRGGNALIVFQLHQP